MKPVLGFNNEAQNWLQFSLRKIRKGDTAGGGLQAPNRSMISSWRPQQDSQPLGPPSSTNDTGGQGDGCGGWTSAGAHTRPCRGQAGPSRAIPRDSCHVGLPLRLGRPCGSTHQQQLQVTVAHFHFLASHSGPRIGFRSRAQM
jgi:hypothetical protein